VNPALLFAANHLWQSTVFAVMAGIDEYRQPFGMVESVHGPRLRDSPRQWNISASRSSRCPSAPRPPQSALRRPCRAPRSGSLRHSPSGSAAAKRNRRPSGTRELRAATAVHTTVEALCWLHPHTYAEGILRICKFYLASPIACMSGVTGADLKSHRSAVLSALPFSGGARAAREISRLTDESVRSNVFV
jgi:hypothetical protein